MTISTNTLPILVTAMLLSSGLSVRAVEILDPGLERAVREALGKTHGDISLEDMQSLVHLDASYNTRQNKREPPPLIQSLEGLETATNLKHLDLSGHCRASDQECEANVDLFDLVTLEALTKLEHLNLANNQLTELFLPDNAANLRTLNLSGNELSEIEFPQDKRHLTTLDLSHNQFGILDLPPDLVSLERLQLEGNRLNHLDIPESLKKLTILDLSENHLHSLALHGGLTDLTELNLENNEFNTFHIPEEITNLRIIRLGTNRLTRLFLPDTLVALTTLDLKDNRLVELTLPLELNRLRFLDVTGNPIEQLSLPPNLDLDNLVLWGFEKPQIPAKDGISIIRTGDGIEIRWTDGILQVADKLDGPWIDVPIQGTKHSTAPSNRQSFYRSKRLR